MLAASLGSIELIYESWHWKKRLAKDAETIERWASKAAVTDRRSFLLEEKIFLAAYAVRKLADLQKLESSFDDRVVLCQMFSSTSDEITISNNHRPDELYDFSKSIRSAIRSIDLLNLIIHSLIFIEVMNDDFTVQAFLVTSDKKRYNGLWMVSIRDFIKLIRKAANSYPSTLVRVFDRDHNDWFSWRGEGEPPQHIRRKIETIRASLRPRSPR